MKTRCQTFSLEDIAGFLNGTKTECRLPMKNRPIKRGEKGEYWLYTGKSSFTSNILELRAYDRKNGNYLFTKKRVRPLREFMLDHCPYGKVGDHLIVREAWRTCELQESGADGILYRDGQFQQIGNTFQEADAWVEVHNNGSHGDRWRSPATMPRWASRLTLEITAIRVQKKHFVLTVKEVNPKSCASTTTTNGQPESSNRKTSRPRRNATAKNAT